MECVPCIPRLRKSDESVEDLTAGLKEQGARLKVSSLHTVNLCDMGKRGVGVYFCWSMGLWWFEKQLEAYSCRGLQKSRCFLNITK